jgi:hypothetical protein
MAGYLYVSKSTAFSGGRASKENGAFLPSSVSIGYHRGLRI